MGLIRHSENWLRKLVWKMHKGSSPQLRNTSKCPFALFAQVSLVKQPKISVSGIRPLEYSKAGRPVSQLPFLLFSPFFSSPFSIFPSTPLFFLFPSHFSFPPSHLLSSSFILSFVSLSSLNFNIYFVLTWSCILIFQIHEYSIKNNEWVLISYIIQRLNLNISQIYTLKFKVKKF